MKRVLGAALMGFMFLALAGCGGGDHAPPPLFKTEILSDPVYDGDIAKDPTTGFLSVAQGSTQVVSAGIDPATGVEYRAFLDFPLTGAGGVPSHAIIDSAFLDIFISSIQTQTAAVTLRIDLVDFQPPTLIDTDFYNNAQPALDTLTVPIFQSDFDNHVSVDVTPLMVEAQRLGLIDFQIRILQGPSADGVVDINDTTGPSRGLLAPQLQVTYF